MAERAAVGSEPGDKTRVFVMGTIHGRHRSSESYSLAVLEAAIRRARPDVILAEIPPDRIDQAVSSFAATGEVDEPRTRVFPEYTEVAFPLSRELGFRILGTAGWTQAIADDRRAALERIASDPARSREWAEHQAAQRRFAEALAGRGDDPRFIHTREYDDLVAASRQPYERYFEADLGDGGWNAINRAHTDLINSALDQVSGHQANDQPFRVLITFGTAHKYKILQSLDPREDITIEDTRALFA